MATTFQHSPLLSTALIRVLDLVPSNKRYAPLRCNIREVSLKPPVVSKYEALSYVWGNKNETSLILCNGKEFPVTNNLMLALCHLRQRFSTRTLRIDAICINQAEDENAIKERNHQVMRMGEIYQNAERVVIWLGLGDTFTPALFRYLKATGPIQKAKQKYLYVIRPLDALARSIVRVVEGQSV